MKISFDLIKMLNINGINAIICVQELNKRREKMKELLDYVEKYQNMIFEAEQYIWTHPETGYRKAIKTGLQSYGTVIRSKQNDTQMSVFLL